MTAACVLLFGHDPDVCGHNTFRDYDNRSEPRWARVCGYSNAVDRAINGEPHDQRVADLVSGHVLGIGPAVVVSKGTYTVSSSSIEELNERVARKTEDYELAERMMLLWGARVDELVKAGKGPAKR